MKSYCDIEACFLNLEKKLSNIIGYVYALLSVLLFVNGNFFIKLTPNLTSSQILIYRSIQHTIYSYLLMKVQKLDFHYKNVKVNRLLILRAFFGFVAVSFNYYAITLLPLSTSVVIVQIQPIFVGIFAAVLLKEKYELPQIITGLLCMVGVVFVAQPSFIFDKESGSQLESWERFKGVISLVVSSAAAAMVQVLVREVGGKSNMGIITLYYGLISTIFVPIITTVQGFNEIQINNIPPLLGVGILTFVAQLLRNRAALFGKAAKVAIIGYFGIAYSYILDIFILGSEIDLFSLIGTLFIVSCLIVSIYTVSKK